MSEGDRSAYKEKHYLLQTVNLEERERDISDPDTTDTLTEQILRAKTNINRHIYTSLD